jgi:hypothetical protein
MGVHSAKDEDEDGVAPLLANNKDSDSTKFDENKRNAVLPILMSCLY